jgi:hypothetical protein
VAGSEPVLLPKTLRLRLAVRWQLAAKWMESFDAFASWHWLPKTKVARAAWERTRAWMESNGWIAEEESTGRPTSMPTAVALPVAMERRSSMTAQQIQRHAGVRRMRGQPLANLQVLSYGSIRFPGGSSPPSKWARLPIMPQTGGAQGMQECLVQLRMPSGAAGMIEGAQYAGVVLQLLTETWGLKPPTAVVSVLGPWSGMVGTGENVIEKNPSIQSMLRGALRRSIVKCGAWVFTRGLQDEKNENVISLVGRAIEGTDVPCIGFVPWSIVAEKEALDKKRGQIHFSNTGKCSSILDMVDKSTGCDPPFLPWRVSCGDGDVGWLHVHT